MLTEPDSSPTHSGTLLEGHTTKKRYRPLWLTAHALSLEGPLLATLWCWALTRLHDQIFFPGVLAGLGFAVTAIYWLDRVLDASGSSSEISEKHPSSLFVHYRALFIVGILFCGLCALYYGFFEVPSGYLVHGCILLFLSLLYLSAQLKINRLSWAWPLKAGLLKHIVGGTLFAMGCTAWNRFLMLDRSAWEGLLETLFPAMLFIHNLSSISFAYQPRTPDSVLKRQNLRFFETIVICLVTLFFSWQGKAPPTLGLLATATALGAALLIFVCRFREKLQPLSFRFWADMALVPPALALGYMPFFRSLLHSASLPF